MTTLGLYIHAYLRFYLEKTLYSFDVYDEPLKMKYKFHLNAFISSVAWGKLLFKVMQYNIALLHKKVTNFVT